ncbi:YbhB/YbcL family Raf kinase inhibitor-like protein [Phaeobacter gallaeciensis]|nr:YbhB/YbcL family Raf kinase inhibitor-like protein [Phaeobacter gallaeciensis]
MRLFCLPITHGDFAKKKICFRPSDLSFASGIKIKERPIMHLKTVAAAILTTLAFGTAHAGEPFILSSPELASGQSIPAKYYWNNFGCSGENARPELSWSGAPEGTKSFALTFYDKDAPTGSGFWHWSVYNIPLNATGIGTDIPKGAIENNTDLNQPGFFGPCPPVGRTHSYVYTVYALSVPSLDLPENASAALAGFFYNSNTLATATLEVIAGPREE